jgi:flavin-dependent dehydrogenase
VPAGCFCSKDPFPFVAKSLEEMKEHRTVAIVGGGPAGAHAAELLSAGGFPVRLYDEKIAWEKPCGGGLTFKALKPIIELGKLAAKPLAE